MYDNSVSNNYCFPWDKQKKDFREAKLCLLSSTLKYSSPFSHLTLKSVIILFNQSLKRHQWLVQFYAISHWSYFDSKRISGPQNKGGTQKKFVCNDLILGNKRGFKVLRCHKTCNQDMRPWSNILEDPSVLPRNNRKPLKNLTSKFPHTTSRILPLLTHC